MTVTQSSCCYPLLPIFYDTIAHGVWLWNPPQHGAPGSCLQVTGTQGKPSLPGPEGHLLFQDSASPISVLMARFFVVGFQFLICHALIFYKRNENELLEKIKKQRHKKCKFSFILVLDSLDIKLLWLLWKKFLNAYSRFLFLCGGRPATVCQLAPIHRLHFEQHWKLHIYGSFRETKCMELLRKGLPQSSQWIYQHMCLEQLFSRLFAH